MPKQQKNETVIHDWVGKLTFQQQALLMTAMRGPDGCTKWNYAKCIVRFLRGAVLKPAGDWSGLNDNEFMWGDYNEFEKMSISFWGDHDQYPHHFLMHLIHCAQVVGYKHPNDDIREHWNQFYHEACKSFHMNPETEDLMDIRLNDFGCGYHNSLPVAS